MIDYEFIRNWYSRYDVRYKLISYLHNREFALIIPNAIDRKNKENNIYMMSIVRMLKAHNIQSIHYILNDGVRMFRGINSKTENNIPFNLYYSLAKYKDGIPNSTMNLAKRDFSSFNFDEEIISYDFLIDIDGSHDNIYYAHKSALIIITLFNRLNIPYEIRFSGRGFHIVIPFVYFEHLKLSFIPSEQSNIYRLYIKIAAYFSKNYSEMIDTRIYDSRRVCKIPFSIAIYEDESYLSFPFISLDDFIEFKLELYNIKNLSNVLTIKYVESKIFNINGSIEPLLELIKWQK